MSELEGLFGLFLLLLEWMLTPILNRLPGHVPKRGLKRERKRQARGQIKHGLELLRQGCVDEADIRFGAALKIEPQ